MTQQTWAKRPTEILAACRGHLGTIAFFSFFINMLQLTLPLYTLELYDRVIQASSYETLVMLTLIALFCLAITGVLTMIRTKVMSRLGERLDVMFSDRVLSASVRKALGSSEARTAQGLRDLATLRGFLAGNECITLMDAPWTPIYLIVIFAFDSLLGMVALSGAVIIAVLAIVNDIMTRAPQKRAGMSNITAFSNAEAMVRNAEVIEAMGLMPSVRRRWESDYEQVRIANRSLGDTGNTLSQVGRFIRMALQIGISAAGAVQVMEHSITPGAMIVSSILMGRALAPIENAIGTWRVLLGAKASYGRLKNLTPLMPVEQNAMPLPRPTGQVTVERLGYAPPGSAKAIIRGISFSIEAGEALGVVGPSAAGKSSLGKLLVGVWRPQSGAVRLDGADVATWDSDDRGQYVGFLPQDVELFNGSIRYNIARLNEGDPDLVVDAARVAGVHDMILKLPDGYETKIGDGGVVLSGGQRQRIGLARAFYGSPPLIVLDEPNASLDQEGETALVEGITTMKGRGCTIIIIAHRPAVLANVDKLMVMREGLIEMFGPRPDVLARLSAPAAGRPRVVGQ